MEYSSVDILCVNLPSVNVFQGKNTVGPEEEE